MSIIDRKKQSNPAVFSLKQLTLVCMTVAAVAAVIDHAAYGASSSQAATWTATIDKAAWSKWGLQYPVTYVFRLPDVPAGLEVKRRDANSAPWTPLAKKTSAEFFNGVECVRLDQEKNKVYVSVGFQTTNTIQLQFAGVASAVFEGVAKHYDNRRAAYTLSNDNWGCNPWAKPGAPWHGPTSDESDRYQAALHVCRSFHLPVTMAINSRSAGGEAMWRVMQEELDRGDYSWEPVVHGRTHPRNANEYHRLGYEQEILGCRKDILEHLHDIPYGQYVVEHILTFGYVDDEIQKTDAGEFLFLRGFNWLDNPSSNDYVPWNKSHGFYGVGGLNTKGYDTMLQQREPKGRFYARDVAELNASFDGVYRAGGVFYALWHPDRFLNSVLYDPAPGKDGQCGSTLMQHLAHVANRKDVWYVANGWLYSYRYVAENVNQHSNMNHER
jgi:hypothetical protein